MSTRALAHAKQEKAIFDAFLVAYPSFANEVKKVDQPDAPFPDVVVGLVTGELVDFELGEWLDGPHGARVESEEPSPRVFFIRDVENPVRAPTYR